MSASADLAHLVERHLAKVEVAGSSPVIRSIKKRSPWQTHKERKLCHAVGFFIIKAENSAMAP